MVEKNIDTFYEHYVIDGSKEWSVNLPFLCVNCGNCCSLGYFISAWGSLVAYPSEEKIAEMNQIVKPYLEEYNRIIDEEKSKLNAYLKKTKCPFLKQHNACEIYPYRFKGCQLFPKTDFGMGSEEGFCESLDRFKKLRIALSNPNDWLEIETFFIIKDGIRQVKMTKKQYERCVARLLKAGMTPEELVLFKKLNSAYR